MGNIKFNYQYRDAGNYKVHGKIIFSNPEKISITDLENKLRSKLIDFEFFDPDDLKLPRLIHSAFKYDQKLDHSWNEFVSLEYTVEKPTHPQTFSQFLESVGCMK